MISSPFKNVPGSCIHVALSWTCTQTGKGCRRLLWFPSLHTGSHAISNHLEIKVDHFLSPKISASFHFSHSIHPPHPRLNTLDKLLALDVLIAVVLSQWIWKRMSSFPSYISNQLLPSHNKKVNLVITALSFLWYCFPVCFSLPHNK